LTCLTPSDQLCLGLFDLLSDDKLINMMTMYQEQSRSADGTFDIVKTRPWRDDDQEILFINNRAVLKKQALVTSMQFTYKNKKIDVHHARDMAIEKLSTEFAYSNVLKWMM
jgi:hypothetical protein